MVFPFQTTVVISVLAIAYFILNSLNSNLLEDRAKTKRRENALLQAKMFLSPYKDIWRNLKLSNKKCELRLEYDGRITARDKINPNRKFDVIHTNVHSMSDLWDLFCIRFTHNTSFDGLIEMCELFKADINLIDNSPAQTESESDSNNNNSIVAPVVYAEKTPKQKLDINNASEIEITELPGISIVLAKKLIKRRDEIKGFKSVNEVCTFLKLKPHLENQLRELIYINKIKGTKQIQRYDERNLDL